MGGKSDFAILQVNGIPQESANGGVDHNNPSEAAENNDVMSIQLKRKLGSNARRGKDQVEIIQWNPTAQNEGLILTSTMNAMTKIYLYDVESSNPKPIREFKGHTNKTRVSWNPFNPSQFISGSLDKKIYMWDLKQGDKHSISFPNLGVKIKHVAYDPHNEHQFAAGDADGSVKIWDFRHNTKPCDVFQAQSPGQGELTYLDWHPTVPYKMLTAGSDCNIYGYNV